jgi:nicotinate phosphoribosyltransferase
MKGRGQKLRGVRLDSGDMAVLSKQVREILDDAGLKDTLVLASSGFDEYKIADVLAHGARLDGFGVGTNMGVSKDVPTTDMAYKMVEYDGRPVLKLSADKVTLPGKKQLLRIFDDDGRFKEDAIVLREEEPTGDASPLLTKVMEDGRRLFSETLEETRVRCATSLKKLPEAVGRIMNPAEYTIHRSNDLQKLAETVAEKARGQIEKS